eukprot:ANDGO_03445.mRNA.1 hypothetical protein
MALASTIRSRLADTFSISEANVELRLAHESETFLRPTLEALATAWTDSEYCELVSLVLELSPRPAGTLENFVLTASTVFEDGVQPVTVDWADCHTAVLTVHVPSVRMQPIPFVSILKNSLVQSRWVRTQVAEMARDLSLFIQHLFVFQPSEICVVADPEVSVSLLEKVIQSCRAALRTDVLAALLTSPEQIKDSLRTRRDSLDGSMPPTQVFSEFLVCVRFVTRKALSSEPPKMLAGNSEQHEGKKQEIAASTAETADREDGADGGAAKQTFVMVEVVEDGVQISVPEVHDPSDASSLANVGLIFVAALVCYTGLASTVSRRTLLTSMSWFHACSPSITSIASRLSITANYANSGINNVNGNPSERMLESIAKGLRGFYVPIEADVRQIQASAAALGNQPLRVYSHFVKANHKGTRDRRRIVLTSSSMASCAFSPKQNTFVESKGYKILRLADLVCIDVYRVDGKPNGLRGASFMFSSSSATNGDKKSPTGRASAGSGSGGASFSSGSRSGSFTRLSSSVAGTAALVDSLQYSAIRTHPVTTWQKPVDYELQLSPDDGSVSDDIEECAWLVWSLWRDAVRRKDAAVGPLDGWENRPYYMLKRRIFDTETKITDDFS